MLLCKQKFLTIACQISLCPFPTLTGTNQRVRYELITCCDSWAHPLNKSPMQNDRAVTVYNPLATTWAVKHETPPDQLSPKPEWDEIRGGKRYFHCHTDTTEGQVEFVLRRKLLHTLFFSVCWCEALFFHHNTKTGSNNTHTELWTQSIQRCIMQATDCVGEGLRFSHSGHSSVLTHRMDCGSVAICGQRTNGWSLPIPQCILSA